MLGREDEDGWLLAQAADYILLCLCVYIGPGTQVIIKKPKARPAGKTPYAEDTIHPNTLLFLSELKDNNRREWLKRKYTMEAPSPLTPYTP